jgi:AcrR family transcriptional regulator
VPDAPVTTGDSIGPLGRSGRSTQTRRRILEAAANVFEECGYAAASMDGIAAASSVTKATIYYHFDSKEALYRTITVEHALRANQFVDSVSASALSPSGKVIELIWNVVAGVVHEKTVRLLWDHHADLSPEVREVVRESQHHYLDALAEQIRAARDDAGAPADDATVMALAAFESIGRTIRWFQPHGRLPAEEVGIILVHMFLRALLPAGADAQFDRLLAASEEGFFPRRFSLITPGDV